MRKAEAYIEVYTCSNRKKQGWKHETILCFSRRFVHSYFSAIEEDHLCSWRAINSCAI